MGWGIFGDWQSVPKEDVRPGLVNASAFPALGWGGLPLRSRAGGQARLLGGGSPPCRMGPSP